MADARIEFFTFKDRSWAAVECGPHSVVAVSNNAGFLEGFRKAIRYHVTEQCPPGGCPLHTLEVARD